MLYLPNVDVKSCITCMQSGELYLPLSTPISCNNSSPTSRTKPLNLHLMASRFARSHLNLHMQFVCRCFGFFRSLCFVDARCCIQSTLNRSRYILFRSSRYTMISRQISMWCIFWLEYNETVVSQTQTNNDTAKKRCVLRSIYFWKNNSLFNFFIFKCLNIGAVCFLQQIQNHSLFQPDYPLYSIFFSLSLRERCINMYWYEVLSTWIRN